MNNELQELSKEADKVIDEWIDERLKNWGIIEDEKIDLKDLFEPTVKDYMKNLKSRVTNVSVLPTYSIINFSNNKQTIIRTDFLKDCFSDGLDELMIYDYERFIKEYREWRDGLNE